MSFVPPPAGEVPPVSPLRRATLLCLAALTIMSGATIAPSLPALQAHFANHADSQLLSRLVLTLPALFIALCAPVAGAICDRFGRMGILMVSVLLYGLAGLSGLVADSLSAILAGRTLLGVSVAGIMTSITALVGDYFSGREREKYMS
ncbi:MFS transporter [Microbulbifer thermotolerans]|nr:MFS transporter [Microbulbifer thermotolerans]